MNGKLLELCCGTGTISRAFMDQGWQAVGVDIIDHGYPGRFIKSDIQDFTTKEHYDVIWASPPCTEFSTAKYYAYGNQCEMMGLDLVQACQRVIMEVKPRYWILENVPRLAGFIDRPTEIVKYGKAGGSKRAFFWGVFPPFGMLDSEIEHRHDNYGNSDIRRSKIPEPLARAIAARITQAFKQDQIQS